MIHISTGNLLDVVYSYDDAGNPIIAGIMERGRDLIPLPNPRGLVNALQSVLERTVCPTFSPDPRPNSSTDEPRSGSK